jgi:class 3 adenylate cyclase/tetratricopeptide (TPR) repeat protein
MMQTSHKLSDTLASYVPQHVMRRVAAHPTPLTAPTADQFSATMLFADIAGFTPLAERLAQQGAAGTEELSRLLNAYFGPLIDLITTHGGDVYSFAGDALLAVWPAPDADGSLATATLHAAQCGLAIQAHLHNSAMRAGERLQLRLGLGAGEISALHVGGVGGRWKFLLAGPDLAQMYAAAPQAQPGQVVLSPQAWALVHASCTGQPLPTGAVRLTHVRHPRPLAPVLPLLLPPETGQALSAYLPRGILARLEAGHSQWLAELRRATVLFLHLSDFGAAEASVFERVQPALQAMQTVVYQYEGTIRHLIFDDKGGVLVVAFGLPPFAHEDDAVRGVQAARDLHAALHQVGERSAIGITTGHVYCGVVGNETRCEYALIGDVVNLAARLMQQADDEVLCDESTYQAAQPRLRFDRLPDVQVKGKTEPVPLYRPHGQLQRKPLAPATLIGRRAERQLLLDKLQALQDSGSGSTVVLEGEAGIGKSRLLDALRQQAETAGLTALFGAGDALEALTAYHIWRPVFQQLFGFDTLPDDTGTRRAHVLAQLSAEPELERLAPLLNAVLPLDTPESELTRQMTSEVRATNTQDLLVRLLQHTVRTTPLVVLLEDAHWWDSASWAVAQLVNRDVQSVLLVLTTRPLPEPVPAAAQPLLQASGVQWVRLSALPPEDTAALVCQRLGAATVSAPVLDFIYERAEGHPFFSEELAFALREAGLIRVADGVCRLAPAVEDLRAASFPDTVQGVVTSRMDRLPPAHQLALKVASVIGRVFAWRALHAVYPLKADRARLMGYLADLQRADFTVLDSPEPDLAYLFKHVITQEVAYNLLLVTQRRELHQAIAEWYERTYAHDLAPFSALLAHHWRRAEREARAMEYLAQAGEQAVQAGAYQEAVNFLRDTLALDDRLARGTARVQRAHWERQLGVAYFGLGHFAESRLHWEQAATLLGFPVPTTRAGWGRRILGQLLLRVLRYCWPVRAAEPSAEAQTALREMLLVNERLGMLAFYAGDAFAIVGICMLGANLVKTAGPFPGAARVYADLSYTVGCVSLRTLAETYHRRALDLCQGVGQLSERGWVRAVRGLYVMGSGQWTEAEDQLGQAVAIFEQLGDRRHWAECMALLACLANHQGNFSRAAQIFATVHTEVRRYGDVQLQYTDLVGEGAARWRLGQTDKALACLEAALTSETDLDHLTQIWSYGLLALTRLHQGDPQGAQQAAETAANLIRHTTPIAVFVLDGYAAVAEVYLALWAASRGQPSAERRRLRRAAWQACAALHVHAWVFPISSPRAWLWRGVHDWTAGKPSKAHKAWHKSLAAAERLSMPYEEGLAHYEIGRHLPAGDSARRDHVTRACEIFTRLEAAYDLACAQTVLTA